MEAYWGWMLWIEFMKPQLVWLPSPSKIVDSEGRVRHNITDCLGTMGYLQSLRLGDYDSIGEGTNKGGVILNRDAPLFSLLQTRALQPERRSTPLHWLVCAPCPLGIVLAILKDLEPHRVRHPAMVRRQRRAMP